METDREFDEILLEIEEANKALIENFYAERERNRLVEGNPASLNLLQQNLSTPAGNVQPERAIRGPMFDPSQGGIPPSIASPVGATREKDDAAEIPGA